MSDITIDSFIKITKKGNFIKKYIHESKKYFGIELVDLDIKQTVSDIEKNKSGFVITIYFEHHQTKKKILDFHTNKQGYVTKYSNPGNSKEAKENFLEIWKNTRKKNVSQRCIRKKHTITEFMEYLKLEVPIEVSHLELVLTDVNGNFFLPLFEYQNGVDFGSVFFDIKFGCPTIPLSQQKACLRSYNVEYHDSFSTEIIGLDLGEETIEKIEEKFSKDQDFYLKILVNGNNIQESSILLYITKKKLMNQVVYESPLNNSTIRYNFIKLCTFIDKELEKTEIQPQKSLDFKYRKPKTCIFSDIKEDENNYYKIIHEIFENKDLRFTHDPQTKTTKIYNFKCRLNSKPMCFELNTFTEEYPKKNERVFFEKKSSVDEYIITSTSFGPYNFDFSNIRGNQLNFRCFFTKYNKSKEESELNILREIEIFSQDNKKYQNIGYEIVLPHSPFRMYSSVDKHIFELLLCTLKNEKDANKVKTSITSLSKNINNFFVICIFKLNRKELNDCYAEPNCIDESYYIDKVGKDYLFKVKFEIQKNNDRGFTSILDSKCFAMEIINNLDSISSKWIHEVIFEVLRYTSVIFRHDTAFITALYNPFNDWIINLINKYEN